MKLSDAQIYTLRRINSGTRYFMRGDGLKGEEDRSVRYSVDRVNCKSIPVLYKKGLVEFCSDCLKLKSSWYSIRLSSLGKEILQNLKTSGER